MGDLPCERGAVARVLPVAAMLPLRKLRGGPPILIRRKGVVGAVLGDPDSSSSTAHSSIDSELVEVLALRKWYGALVDVGEAPCKPRVETERRRRCGSFMLTAAGGITEGDPFGMDEFRWNKLLNTALPTDPRRARDMFSLFSLLDMVAEWREAILCGRSGS